MPISTQITSMQVRMASQDISHWKRAIDDARNVLMPRRRRLYELYDIIALDGHLTSVINKRKISVTNQRVHFNERGLEGTVNESVRDFILETPWFYKTVGALCEAKPYGHSLVELIPDKGFIRDVELIPRANVKPESGFLMWDANNESDGLAYREDRQLSRYMIEMGGKKDYGLLMVAAQYVIYKRGAFGDWAQFAELFGMPFREGQYDAWDEEGRIKLEQALSEMGGAGYVVTPKGTVLKFHDNNGTGKSEVFNDLVAACNAEISKIFLGNTMTTDNGSSRSQGEVHKQVEEDINLADLIEMEYLLNWELSDKLRQIGYTVPDGRFFYPQMQDIPLEKRIEIDIKLADKIEIAEEYWYNTYGIPRPGSGPIALPQRTETGNDEDPDDDNDPPSDPEPPADPQPPKADSKKKAGPKVTALYQADACCTPIVRAEDYTLTPEEEQLIEEVYKGKKDGFDSATFLQQINRLKEGLWSVLPPSAEYGTPDHVAATMMEFNINEFGYDKSLRTVLELNMLLDNNQTFSQFKAKANTLLKTYNHHYLRTEYDFAVATAQNASNWNRQLRDASIFPYLKYSTAGDDRVRASHAALDGKVFAINDTSWRHLYPPNGWNCRCELISTTEKDNLINGEDAEKLLGAEYVKMKKNGFAVNRGEINVVFELSDAYLQSLGSLKIPNYNDIGRLSIKELAKKQSPVGRDLTKYTADDVLRYFEQRILNPNVDVMMLKDYSGRQIAANRNTITTHLEGHYLEENRQGLFFLMDEALFDPTEIYAYRYKGKSYQYRYVKIYQELTLIVVVDYEKGLLKLKTWYQLHPNLELEKRSGYPIK